MIYPQNFFSPSFLASARSIALVATLLGLFAFSTGCGKEVIMEPETAFALQADIFNRIETPSYPCAPAITVPIKTGATVLGNVSLQNDPDEFYLGISLGNFKFLEEVYVYTEANGPLPLNTDGDIELEEFPYHYILNQATSQFTLTIPNSKMLSCGSVVVFARITTRNMFGHVTGTTTAWMDGATIANGFATSFCITNC